MKNFFEISEVDVKSNLEDEITLLKKNILEYDIKKVESLEDYQKKCLIKENIIKNKREIITPKIDLTIDDINFFGLFYEGFGHSDPMKRIPSDISTYVLIKSSKGNFYYYFGRSLRINEKETLKKSKNTNDFFKNINSIKKTYELFEHRI